MAAPRKIDWERIEGPWRAGIKSVLQIAAEYEQDTGQKVSHTAINKHFKELGVPRDLSAKIRAKADAIVSKSMVSARVSTETTITDKVVIDASAEEQAAIRIAHRSDIRRNRELVSKLTAEVEAITNDPGLFDRLSEIIGEDATDKQLEAFRRVVSLPGRVGSVKQLVESLKTLIALEREAFGIDSKKSAGQTLDEFLDGLATTEG